MGTRLRPKCLFRYQREQKPPVPGTEFRTPSSQTLLTEIPVICASVKFSKVHVPYEPGSSVHILSHDGMNDRTPIAVKAKGFSF
jgi:hypothetical protein